MERKIFVLLSFVLMLSLVVHALEIGTDFGNGADTFVGNDSKTSSTTVRATTTQLECRYNGGGSRFTCTYFRFDTSEYSGDFTGATLKMDATYIKSSTGRRLDVYGLVDESLDLWDVSTTCYQNAPGMLEPASGWNMGDYLLDDTKLVWLGFLSTPGTNDGTNYPITFSSNTTDLGMAFSDFLNADTNHLVTVVLINATGTSGVNCEDKIASEEYGGDYAAPALVTPEPATLSILGLGVLMFIRRKK